MMIAAIALSVALAPLGALADHHEKDGETEKLQEEAAKLKSN